MKFENEFEILLRALGHKIKEYREKINLTQEDMADGNYTVDYKYYQRIESGKRNITIKTLFKLSKKLNVPLKDLLDIESKK